MRKNTSGKVMAFDQGERTVTLEGGTMFHVVPAVDLTTIRPGDFVVVEYDEIPLKDNIADVVAKSSPNHPARGPIKAAPTPAAKAPPAPTPAVNTTASLKGK